MDEEEQNEMPAISPVKRAGWDDIFAGMLLPNDAKVLFNAVAEHAAYGLFGAKKRKAISDLRKYIPVIKVPGRHTSFEYTLNGTRGWSRPLHAMERRKVTINGITDDEVLLSITPYVKNALIASAKETGGDLTLERSVITVELEAGPDGSFAFNTRDLMPSSHFGRLMPESFSDSIYEALESRVEEGILKARTETNGGNVIMIEITHDPGNSYGYRQEITKVGDPKKRIIQGKVPVGAPNPELELHLGVYDLWQAASSTNRKLTQALVELRKATYAHITRAR